MWINNSIMEPQSLKGLSYFHSELLTFVSSSMLWFCNSRSLAARFVLLKLEVSGYEPCITKLSNFD